MSRRKIFISVSIFTAVVVILISALNPIHKYNKYFISETKWNGIQEARTLNENLVLEYIEFNDYKLIIDKNNNTIYYSLVNDSKNRYNPNVKYSTNNKNTKLVILSDEITDDKVKSDYKFKIMIYTDKEYHIYNLICKDLPMVNIRYKDNVRDKQKSIPIEVYIFNNLANTTNKITISNGKLKINKDNYIFSLNMITPGKNIRDNKISILNMKPNSDYILTAVTNNEEQKTEISNEEPKNQRVEFFINNEYKGMYVLDSIQPLH